MEKNLKNSICSRVYVYVGASLMAQQIRIHLHRKERQEIRVQFLYPEDPLEEGMATNSSILAWRSPWTAEPGRLQSMGLQRVKHD